MPLFYKWSNTVFSIAVYLFSIVHTIWKYSYKESFVLQSGVFQDEQTQSSPFPFYLTSEKAGELV